jgi:hypothetical protein
MAIPEEKKEHIYKELKKDSISDFLQSETLSDIVIINSLTGA